MAIEITVPRLGWNMEEGTFAGWLKRDGQEVRAGEALYRLESDKSTEDIESLDSGILRITEGAPREGDVVKVGVVIAHLVSAGEPSPPVVSRTLPPPLTPNPSPPDVRAGSVSDAAEPTVAHASGSDRMEKPRASPRARRAAKELGVDWSTLQGSGRSGRIRERDVRAAAPNTSDVSVPLTPTRRTIARRMLEAHQTTAPVTLTTTADAGNLVNLREQFKAVGGDAPSYTDLLLKLTAITLQKHPALNARWGDDGIVQVRGVHLGLAVDSEQGLLVPVVHDVPAKTLAQLAHETRDLIDRAHQGKLQADQMQGGTFTITNLGAYGIDAFTPLLNLPQAGILGVGRIQRRAVVVGRKVVAREQVTLSLTFDHRVVDGAPAARFLQALVGLVENPGPWLIS